MKHMYLLQWDPSYETMPPTTGLYAVYTADDLVDHINFAMNQFSQTENLTLGSVMFVVNNNDTTSYFNMCVEQYREGKVFKNDTYLFDQRIIKDCLDLRPLLVHNRTTNTTEPTFDIMAILKEHNISFSFERILNIELKFHLRSIRLALEKKVHKPECYRIVGKIVFDDNNKDGQMIVSLFSSMKEFKCRGKLASIPDDDDDDGGKNGLQIDICVISLCAISFILCFRSFYIAYKLYKRTKKYIELSRSGMFEFVNLWFVLILINDILSITGSSFKISLDKRYAESSSMNYDTCALTLGIGGFLAFTILIRYICYLKTFNILTLVLNKALPDMARFLGTTMILYLGFMFCGWAVLGPYHKKFRHLSTTSDCLFSLINGDDMFATFSATMDENVFIWYFSRFYLYFFIWLFIYAVLNLFIAVILDTYETIKRYYKDGFPKTMLREFIDEYAEPLESKKCCSNVIDCFRRPCDLLRRDNSDDNSRENSEDNSENPTERTPLVPGQRDSVV